MKNSNLTSDGIWLAPHRCSPWGHLFFYYTSIVSSTWEPCDLLLIFRHHQNPSQFSFNNPNIPNPTSPFSVPNHIKKIKKIKTHLNSLQISTTHYEHKKDKFDDTVPNVRDIGLIKSPKPWPPAPNSRTLFQNHGQELGKAVGLIRVWLQGTILHLDSIRLRRETLAMEKSIFGIGLFLGAVAIRYGYDCGCISAELPYNQWLWSLPFQGFCLPYNLHLNLDCPFDWKKKMLVEKLYLP